jgi:peptidyl-prolyl cis-trans isomerase C
MLPLQDIRERLLERARALGLQADSEEQLLDALLDREVQVAPPSDDDCRRFHAQRPELFRSGDLIEADHILFAVTDAVPPAPLRQRAQQVLDAALAEPERFASLAAEYSNCPSAQVGGNLGQLSRIDVVPEFWQALARFEGTGIVPRLVESRFGLHIVRVARRVEGRTLPFEAVRPQIEARLREHMLRQALRDYAHGLLHEAAEGPLSPAPVPRQDRGTAIEQLAAAQRFAAAVPQGEMADGGSEARMNVRALRRH